jgi:RNA polymerase sigma-B factor
MPDHAIPASTPAYGASRPTTPRAAATPHPGEPDGTPSAASFIAMLEAGGVNTAHLLAHSQRWSQSDVRDVSDQLLVRMRKVAAGGPEHVELRRCLVQLNMPLVRNAARRYRSRSEPMEDIVQVGTIGLIKAIDRFDPERGSFLAFAIPTIAGEIKRFFRDTSWWVRVPRRLRDRRLELVRTTDELTQRLGRSPTAAELATHLSIGEEDVIEGLDACAAYGASSLDAAQFGDEEMASLGDLLGEEDGDLDLVEYRHDLEPALGGLPEREREIVLLRFYGNMTQAQIGELVGISQMHVSRLLARSLRHLRNQLEAAP